MLESNLFNALCVASNSLSKSDSCHALSGLFDLKGLRLLKKKIAGLEAIMTPDEDDEDPLNDVLG